MFFIYLVKSYFYLPFFGKDKLIEDKLRAEDVSTI